MRSARKSAMFFVTCCWFGDIPGLVLYNGQYDSARGDYVCFGMRGGYPEFGFDVGSGPALIQGNKTLSLNQWNSIKLKRENSVGENFQLLWDFFFKLDIFIHFLNTSVKHRCTMRIFLFFVNFAVLFQRQKNKPLQKNRSRGVFVMPIFTNLEVVKN